MNLLKTIKQRLIIFWNCVILGKPTTTVCFEKNTIVITVKDDSIAVSFGDNMTKIAGINIYTYGAIVKDMKAYNVSMEQMEQIKELLESFYNDETPRFLVNTI